MAFFDSVTDYIINNNPLISIGILAYNGEKYFDYLFTSLFEQNYKNIEILILDNASSNNDEKILKNKFANMNNKVHPIVYKTKKNLGFGGGHNFLINKMKGDFYLCLNQDIILENSFVSELVKAINKNPKYGSATGKILKWDFHKLMNKRAQLRSDKTNIIDTVGIKAFASHRFEDEGQTEIDQGQFNDEKEIFAGSGAAMMYRKKALKDIIIPPLSKRELERGQYFDEQMFMYKEDIDLGYRLQWAGWKCIYTPKAIAYHDRSVAKKSKGFLGILKNRKSKSVQIRKWSYINHQILLKKNFSKDYSWKIKLKTFIYNLKTKIWIYLFERDILGVIKEFRSKRKELREIERKVDAREIERYFV